MKNKKIITLCMSFFTTLGLVSCGATDSKVETEYPVETFITEDVVSHGLQINRLASGTDANDHEYQTFLFIVLPSTSINKDCSASITFADNRQNGSLYLTATVDNANLTCSVTMLEFFDSVATLRLQNIYYSNIYAEVTIRLNPRYTIKANSFNATTLYSANGSDTQINSYLSQSLYADMIDNTEVSTNAYQNGLFATRYVSSPDNSGRGFNIVPSDLNMSIFSSSDPSGGWSSSYDTPISWNNITAPKGTHIFVEFLNYVLENNHSFCFPTSSALAIYLNDVKNSYNNSNVPEYWDLVNTNLYSLELYRILAYSQEYVDNVRYGYFAKFTLDLSKVTWDFGFLSDHPLYNASKDITGSCTLKFQMFQDVQSMSTESETITF